MTGCRTQVKRPVSCHCEWYRFRVFPDNPAVRTGFDLDPEKRFLKMEAS